MLAVATSLIAEKGIDSVRMSEIAELAGVSIGSLYQYFPDKAAIVSTLAERYNAEGRACVESELATVRTDAELGPALHRLVDEACNAGWRVPGPTPGRHDAQRFGPAPNDDAPRRPYACDVRGLPVSLGGFL